MFYWIAIWWVVPFENYLWLTCVISCNTMEFSQMTLLNNCSKIFINTALCASPSPWMLLPWLLPKKRNNLSASGGSRNSQRGCANPRGGAPTYWSIFPENCMKIRNFGSRSANVSDQHIRAKASGQINYVLQLHLKRKRIVNLTTVTLMSLRHLLEHRCKEIKVTWFRQSEKVKYFINTLQVERPFLIVWIVSFNSDWIYVAWIWEHE